MNQKDKSFPQWEFLAYNVVKKNLVCGRFALGPLKKGQGQLISSTLRRTLFNAIECTCFTHVKFRHSRATNVLQNIYGVKESISEILDNFNQIKLKRKFRSDLGDLQGPLYASIDLQGLRSVRAKDIKCPPGIVILNKTQVIATITENVRFFAELTIETNSADSLPPRRLETRFPPEDGYAIDAVFTPVQKFSESIHLQDFENENLQTEMLFLEISTDGRVTPYDALLKASEKVITLFLSFYAGEKKGTYSDLAERVRVKAIKSSDFGEDSEDCPDDWQDSEDWDDWEDADQDWD
uniref:RpoA n=1 Tax=Pelargonium luridum TaxID=73208 RepID=A0A1Y0K5R1_9ROSI|nr:RpoA [Pelargonium luridum]